MSATDRINALGAWIDRGLEWDDAAAHPLLRAVETAEAEGVTA